MADEETATDETLECSCVKWHSPKGPVTLLGDTPVCLVTKYQVERLLDKYAAKGRVVKADQRGATKFQKELSEKLHAAGVTSSSAPAVEEEPVAVESQEPASADA